MTTLLKRHRVTEDLPTAESVAAELAHPRNWRRHDRRLRRVDLECATTALMSRRIAPGLNRQALSKHATTTVMLSFPPRSLASDTKRSQALCGSGSSVRIAAIRASGTISV